MEQFRQNAVQYGCSQEEIDYIEEKMNKSNDNLVFNKKQFQVFCEHWKMFEGQCPGSWRFNVYPKSNGILIEYPCFPVIWMELVHISEKYQHYQPSFGPRFIEDIIKCWDKYKTNSGNLVLISDGRKEKIGHGYTDNKTYFNTFGLPEMTGFIGGGRVYHEPSARPMEPLEEIHSRHHDTVYDIDNRIVMVEGYRS